MARDPLSVLLAGAAVGIVGTTLLMAAAKRVEVANIAFVALALRALYGFASYAATGGQGTDSVVYDRNAQHIAVAWATGEQQVELATGKEGWTYILAAIYRTLGYAPELAILLNALFGAAAVVVVAATCQVLGWQQAKRPAALLMAFWPVAVLWGPLLLREAIVTFLLATGMLGASFVYVRRTMLGLALLISSGALMLWMRGGLAFLLLVVFPAIAAVAGLLARRDRSSLARLSMLGAIALLVALPALSSRFAEVGYFDPGRQEVVARALDTGATGFSATGASTEGVWRYVNVAFGPLPTSWGNAGLVAAGIDAALWLLVWIFAYIGFRRIEVNRWAILVAVIPSMALLVYLGDTATNFGLIMRMRAMMLPLIAPIAGFGIAVILEHLRSTRISNKARRAKGRADTSRSLRPRLEAK